MAGSKFLLTMTLTRQGDVKGSSTVKEGNLDYSKGMECHGFEYGCVTPIDFNSGAHSGKRNHNPITIRREVDAASPKLLQALWTNETFTTAKLFFSGTSSHGKPIVAHTIELIDGSISHIRQATDSSGKWRQDVTLTFHELIVDGLHNGLIPWNLSQRA